MEVLILDELGRVQIPNHILSQLGLNQEKQLSLEIQNDKLILQALPKEPEVENVGRVLVVKSFPTGNLDTIIDELREKQITDLTTW